MTRIRHPSTLPVMNDKSPTRDDVIRLFGKISDHGVVDILDAGPTIEQLEEVAMWLAQEDDVMGEARRSLTAVPSSILEMLMRDEEYVEDQRE